MGKIVNSNRSELSFGSAARLSAFDLRWIRRAIEREEGGLETQRR